MPTMAEPQAKRLKRCHDEVDDSASSSTASSVPRATYAPRKSTVSPRDTKATLLQHITHLEEEKTAAQARLEQENRLLKSLLNQRAREDTCCGGVPRTIYGGQERHIVPRAVGGYGESPRAKFVSLASTSPCRTSHCNTNPYLTNL
ncbi:hypothetical protein EV714DRAFT_249976, partial [Schizophyllum commune]